MSRKEVAETLLNHENIDPSFTEQGNHVLNVYFLTLLHMFAGLFDGFMIYIMGLVTIFLFN